MVYGTEEIDTCKNRVQVDLRDLGKGLSSQPLSVGRYGSFVGKLNFNFVNSRFHVVARIALSRSSSIATTKTTKHFEIRVAYCQRRSINGHVVLLRPQNRNVRRVRIISLHLRLHIRELHRISRSTLRTTFYAVCSIAPKSAANAKSYCTQTICLKLHA